MSNSNIEVKDEVLFKLNKEDMNLNNKNINCNFSKGFLNKKIIKHIIKMILMVKYYLMKLLYL